MWKPSTGSASSPCWHLAGDHADVADIVLRAGVVAAGQVDVDRRIERQPRLDMRRDRLGRALGVGGGELAALCCRCRKPARPAAASPWCARPSASMAAIAASRLLVAYAGENAGSARPSAGYRRRRTPARLRASPSICAAVIWPLGSTTPIQLSPGCFCRWTPICASRSGRGRSLMQSSGMRASGRPSRSSTAATNFSKPQASSRYLSRALLRSVRSPWSMKMRTIASATSRRLLGLQVDARSAGRNPCAR